MWILSLWQLLLALSLVFRVTNCDTFSRERRCPHDQIIQGIQIRESPVSYINHQFDSSRTLPPIYQPIRIRPFYDSSVPGGAARTHAEALVDSAMRYMEQRISLVRVNGPLRFDQNCVASSSNGCTQVSNTCNDAVTGLQITIPNAHLRGIISSPFTFVPTGTGINNADLVVYIASDNTACTATPALPNGGTLNMDVGINSWGAACRVDQYGRPTAGFINLCPALLDRTLDFRVSVKEVVHQLFHILGFSAALYSKFKRPDGSNYPPSEFIDTNAVFPGSVGTWPVIKSPNVLAWARFYYNCPQFPGAVMETFDDNTVGLVYSARFFRLTTSSHWHTRWLMGEMMNPRIWKMRTHSSQFTLALLQDTNWYEIDASGWGEPIRWAYRFGCFLNRKDIDRSDGIVQTCDPNGPVQFPHKFCTEFCATDPTCTFDGFSQADCPSRPEPIISPFTCSKLTDRGTLAIAGAARDIAGLYGVNRQSDFSHACADERAAAAPVNDVEFFREEAPGFIAYWGQKDARCITWQGAVSNVGVCQQFVCGPPGGYDPVTRQWPNVTAILRRRNSGGTISTSVFECLRADVCSARNGPVAELAAYICPNVDTYCVNARPFECKYGWWSDDLNRCICAAGFSGTFCETQTVGPTIAIAAGTTPIPVAPSYPAEICVTTGASTILLAAAGAAPARFFPPPYVSATDVRLTFDAGRLTWTFSRADLGSCNLVTNPSEPYFVEKYFDVTRFCRLSAAWDGTTALTLVAGIGTCQRLQTARPSTSPTKKPTAIPSVSPTKQPSGNPTRIPTDNPTTLQPTSNPTVKPTGHPTVNPSVRPTNNPTVKPTLNPSRIPTVTPTKSPTISPTRQPSKNPSRHPSRQPSRDPSRHPSVNPSVRPSFAPTRPLQTRGPTRNPATSRPTSNPSENPTARPTSNNPTRTPTDNPTTTKQPTNNPTTRSPTTLSPTTSQPTNNPTNPPTQKPVTTSKPTPPQPTQSPSSLSPSQGPQKRPTGIPSRTPSIAPTLRPTPRPTNSQPPIGTNPGDTCVNSFCQRGGDLGAFCAGALVRDGCLCSVGWRPIAGNYCGSKSPTRQKPTLRPTPRQMQCWERLCRSRGDYYARCVNSKCACSSRFTRSYDDLVCVENRRRNFWADN